MRKHRLAAILCCSALLAGSVGCGADKSSSSTASTVDGMEWVTPKEGDQEYDLGSYAIDPDAGVKLYYDSEQFPKELVLALENLFVCYQKRDYASYEKMLLPTYKEKLEAVLQSEYGYGADKSFETQCDNLAAAAEGDGYTVTRVKIQPTINFETEEAGVDDFLKHYSEFLKDDSFAETVKSECDELRIGTFYVMAKAADGCEINLVGEQDIVFALKDGKYYAFG